MGLDMWVEKIKRISEEDKKIQRFRHTKPYTFDECIYITEDDALQSPELAEDIMSYLYKEDFVAEVTKYALICRDNGIPEDAHLWSWGSKLDGVELGFSFGEDSDKRIYLSNDELKRYIEHVIQHYYIAEREEIKYWRKDYGLQEKIHELYHRNYLIREEIMDNPDFEKIDTGLPNVFSSMIQENARKFAEFLKSEFEGITISEVKDALLQINELGTNFLTEKAPKFIVNCGYHRMTREMAKAAGLLAEYKSLKKDEILVYHEWY